MVVETFREECISCPKQCIEPFTMTVERRNTNRVHALGEAVCGYCWGQTFSVQGEIISSGEGDVMWDVELGYPF